MSNWHRRTLEAVFRNPVSATIVWADVESMLVHYGAVIGESEGSRVSINLRGRVAHVHRPHPRKEASRMMIREIRELLTAAGIGVNE
ncbi:MAG TPA: type II toxin-antitoxin system HicA family toxin [Longimicrobium sp.]|nr:type II toxin-antitoxin system HicA family toxin [Longimicrobium sp.]